MANVHDFGAKGDGKADDTLALQHALQKGDGHLVLPRGDYQILRPLYVTLDRTGRFSISGQGGTARILMTGPGPAIHLVGTHNKTAQPSDFHERVWQNERMPVVQDVEIVGKHPEADGIRIDGTMQSILRGVLIRECRHGVHLVHRARNVILDSCHIYNCTGVGVFFDRVNLHQTNIHGCHISYCKQAGIKVAGSEIRNLQICASDIEYNYDEKADGCADVLFDCREGTVREGALTGNTIQAKASPRGANVRFLGVGKDNPSTVGLFAITGNLIGSQETAIHLQACRGVVVTGNCVYSGYRHALLAEDVEHLVIAGNSIDHNPEYKGPSTDQVILRGCRNVSLTGTLLQHIKPAAQEVSASVEVSGCQNVNVVGCQVLGARVQGIAVRDSSVVRVADCTIRAREDDRAYKAAVRVEGKSSKVMVVNNFVTKGADGDVLLPGEMGTASGNIVV
jgi:polygalacturonase